MWKHPCSTLWLHTLVKRSKTEVCLKLITSVSKGNDKQKYSNHEGSMIGMYSTHEGSMIGMYSSNTWSN